MKRRQLVQANGKGNGNGHPAESLTADNLLISPLWKPEADASLEPTAASGEDRVQAIVTMLLLELGLDITSQHFRDTPRRVARFYREFTRGGRVKPAEILKTFRSQNGELIVVSDIQFFSLCPHHLLIYGGKIDFGYIPDGRIVGISKIPRLVQALAARPVVQEDLVSDIADAFMSEVKPLGCTVKAMGKHDCVAARGVRCPQATMITVDRVECFPKIRNMLPSFTRPLGDKSPTYDRNQDS